MKYIFTFLFTIASCTLFGQDLYMVYFKPKSNTTSYFSDPLSMLSQRALTRRVNQSVTIDDKDVPILSTQISGLKSLNLTYVGASKWLNAAMVEVSDPAVINQIEELNFVQSTETLVRNPSARNSNRQRSMTNETEDFDYQNSNAFIQQLNLQTYHNAGFTGQNVLIGVIDSGFPGVNTINAFEALRSENRIIDTKNFVSPASIYNMDSHGTVVLATMAAKVDGEYVGSAPDASYALYVSEDARPESPKELMFWIQAAERADSVGVDVINTSLGYSTFDDPRYDYTYNNMNGETTLITKGANIAASRGIFLVNAMGNDGNSSWHYLSAPADSPQVFSIGANDNARNPGSFSSYGPNSVGVSKPNVSGLGVRTPTYSPNGFVTATNGTSLSSPVIAGAVATLMSAHPNKSITELKTVIEQSAHLYPNIDDQLGYGVPNFAHIFSALNTNEIDHEKLIIYPNPVLNKLTVQSKQKINKIELLDWNGKILKKVMDTNEMNVNEFPKGIYFTRIYLSNGKTLNHKIVKN